MERKELEDVAIVRKNHSLPTSRIYIIGGPNGAGKTTAASLWLPTGVAFVNADEIALDLPDQTGRDIAAGRELFRRFDTLVSERASFAVETTLSNRSLAGRLERVIENGYRFHLFFVWLPSPDLSVERVANRVRAGGHDIPENDIRRRYSSGIRNLVNTYIPLADSWAVFSNSDLAGPSIIARGRRGKMIDVRDVTIWSRIIEEAQDV